MAQTAEDLRETLRDNVAAARRAAQSEDHNFRSKHVYAGVDGYKMDRVAEDAAPGTMSYGERGEPILTREREGLDPQTLELTRDTGRSRRYQPVDDTDWTDAAHSQFRELRPQLAALSRAVPKALSMGNGAAAADAQVAQAIVRRYGVQDMNRLRRVLFMHPASAATVSRMAAVDSMNDLFLGSELIIQSPDIVKIEQRRPFARELFAMRNLNALGATSYEFQSIKTTARAEHVANLRGKAPTATITRKPYRRPLVILRSGMAWDLMDVERWKLARQNGAALPDFVAEQRDAAREALLELESYDLIFGHSELEIQGLLDPANGIPHPAAIKNFADAADGEEAVQLLLTGANAIFSTNMEMPEIIGLGTRDYLYVTQTAYDSSNQNGDTIAQVALKRGKDLGLKAIVRVPEFGYSAEVKAYLIEAGYDTTTAERYAGGWGGKDIMLTWTKNPAKLRGVTGIDLRQLPPDRTSTETSVQMILTTGGVEVRFPKSAHVQQVNAPT